jgi:uncharacterized UPF0160 family protein
VPETIGTFAIRKPLPLAWLGKNGLEFIQISGVPDARFCHIGGFIAAAESKEGALALAQKALDA